MDKKKSLWAIIQVITSSPQFWVAVATVLTALWAWVKGWFASPFAPLTIPVILIVVALTFYITNQIRTNKKQRGLTDLSHKEFESLIWEWLRVSAWTAHPLPLQNETIFAYEVQYHDIHIAVVREKPQPSVIVLETKFSMTSKKTILSEAEWERLGSPMSIDR